jgi:hypothetical protein
MPERHPKLEEVGRRTSRRRVEVGDQAGQRFVPLLGVQGGAQLDDALDVGGSGVAFGMRHLGRDDHDLAGPRDALFPIEGEVGLSGRDDEPFLLAGWTCSVITPPGALRQLKRTSSPLVVSAVAVK